MLNKLPDTARVWVFQGSKFLSDADIAVIQSALSDFVPGWAAHGNVLYGDFEILNKLFIVIGVDESKAPPSGCSIDKMMKVIQELGAKLKVDFLNRLIIAYEYNGAIYLADQQQFKDLVRDGKLKSESIVFNNLVQNRGELNSKWRTSIANSWHSQLVKVV
jgi:hypothetical protein